MRLLTIDILDTTLIRKCGEPYIIFHLLAHKLFPDDRVLRDTFLRWRKSEKPKGAKIADIYTSARIPTAVAAQYSPDELIASETEIERINLVGNPRIAKFVEQKRQEGWTVKFVSDMYLGSDFFRSKLEDEGIYKIGDEVIVSCEWGARKDDCTLYDKIREKYHPSEWSHYGDNVISDIKAAKNRGVKAARVSVPFLKVEKSMVNDVESMHYGWQYEYLSGLSRSARIACGDTPFAHLAADYVAPTLIPYVVNVVKDTIQRGIKTLHFLSRDGYIMYEMANFLFPTTLSLKYTFISRRAITNAFLHICTTEEFCLLYENPEFRELSVDEILSKYFGLDKSTLEQRFGIKLIMTNISDKKNWRLFTSTIFESEAFMKFIKEKTESQYRITVDYLSRQGLFAPDTAVADIGWLGHTRMMLNAIARSCNKAMPLFYYFCVTDNVLDSKYGPFIAYHTQNRYRILCHTPLFESYFCSSPYSTILRYDINSQSKPYAVLADKSRIDNTPIWKANLQATRFIMQALCDSGALDYITQSALDRWGVRCLNNLLHYRYPLDYRVFSCAEGINSDTLAKRIKFRDFPFFCRRADFKFADLAITFGYHQAKIIWSVRDLTIKAIGYMYKLIKIPIF